MFTLAIVAGVVSQYANGLVYVPFERPDGTVRSVLPIQPVTLETSLKKQGYTASRLIKTTIYGMFLVKVELNGKPFTLILDTGAADSIVLGKKVGKSLGFESDTHRDERLAISNAVSSFKYGVGVLESVRILSGDYQDRQSHKLRIFDGFSYTDSVRNIETDREESVVVDGLFGASVSLG